MLNLHRGQQPAFPPMCGASTEEPLKPQGAHAGRYLIRDHVPILDVHGTYRAEVPDAGVVGSLGIANLVGKLRNHEIEVCVPLAVSMGRLVDRHAVDIGLEVGAVIEVVPAHQILAGFSLAAVRSHDESRHRLEQLPRPVLRQQLQFLVINHPFARSGGRSEEPETLGRDRYLLQRAGSRTD